MMCIIVIIEVLERRYTVSDESTRPVIIHKLLISTRNLRCRESEESHSV